MCHLSLGKHFQQKELYLNNQEALCLFNLGKETFPSKEAFQDNVVMVKDPFLKLH